MISKNVGAFLLQAHNIDGGSKSSKFNFSAGRYNNGKTEKATYCAHGFRILLWEMC